MNLGRKPLFFFFSQSVGEAAASRESPQQKSPSTPARKALYY